MFDLKDKIVFITGGSIGIGAKIIELMLDEKVKHITALDIAGDSAVAFQNELNKKYGANKLRFIKGDVTNEEDISRAFDALLNEYGHIDVVINNAGIMNDSRELYKKEIEINLTALTTITLKAIDVMSKENGGKGGVVLNVSSVAALYQDHILPVYFATKSAVLQFSNCIGRPAYYNRTGVRVLTICFGATSTTLLTKEKLGNFDKKIEDKIIADLGIHRYQTAESAAAGALDAIKRGESGSTWLSAADEPARDVSDAVEKAYSILTDLGFTS